jgi:hypothetical protein
MYEDEMKKEKRRKNIFLKKISKAVYNINRKTLFF